MTIERDKLLNQTPDILVVSPLLDSQLLKLKIEKDPVALVVVNPVKDSLLILSLIHI